MGDKKWKQTQKRTGPPNNLVSEGPEGPITKSCAGSIVLTTSATTTDGKRWMAATTPDKWEKKGDCQERTERKTRNKRP